MMRIKSLHMHAVSSNSIESLFEKLLERLEKSRPLKPIVVFASAKLAKHFNHFAALKERPAAITTLFLDSFLEIVGPLMFESAQPRLTHIERAFRLEALISKGSFAGGNKKLEKALEELKRSLHVGTYKSSLFLFCEKLSKLFADYELHGGLDFLEKIGKDSRAEIDLQKGLYRALHNGPFSTVQDLLLASPKELYAHVVFVGFATLPKSAFELMCHIDSSALVEVYSLMPSSHYFADLSVHENKGNALVGALGKQKRALQRQLEDRGAHTLAHIELSSSIEKDEEYQALLASSLDVVFASEKNSEVPTLLEMIKADMALMRTGKKAVEEKPFLSVQIQEYSSAKEEVEGLIRRLALLADKGLLEKGSAHIFVSNIERYKPIIHAALERLEDKIAYRIVGESLWEKNPLADSFFNMVEKGQSAWSATDLQTLVQSPYFLNGYLKDEEKKAFDEFVNTSSFSWGYDSAHQKSYLEEQGFLPNEEAAFPKEKERFSFKCAIDNWLAKSLSEAASFIGKEPLAKVLGALKKLFEDLEPIREKALLSPAKIAPLLSNLLEKYFSISFDQEKEKSYFEELQEAITLLDQLVVGKEDECEVSMVSALHHLKAKFTKPSAPLGSYKGVLFSPFVRAHLSSADFVGLMGFDDSAPYEDAGSKLSSIFGQGLVDMPSASDEAKTLFLDAILCAKKALYISFSNTSPSGEKRLLNSLASSFHTYIESSFCSENEGPLEGLYIEAPKEDKSALKPQFPTAKEPAVKKEPQGNCANNLKEVSLYELSLALTNPLEWFFHKNFKTSFKDREKEVKEENETSDLFLKSKDRLDLIYGEENLEDVKALLEEKGLGGVFSEAAFFDLQASLDDKKRLLKDAGIETSYTIELCAQRKTVCKAKGDKTHFFAPLIQLEELAVRGSIRSAFDKGVISYAKDPLKAHFSKAPYALALKELGLPSAHLHLPSGELKKCPGSLEAIAQYAAFASHRPSIIYPDTLEPLLKKDGDLLKKRLEEKAFGFLPDPHMRALFPKGKKIDSALLIETFYPWAKKLQEALYGE